MIQLLSDAYNQYEPERALWTNEIIPTVIFNKIHLKAFKTKLK